MSQETSFSEWIAKLMHITRMSDNQFSILVCSKWERKPTLHLNYIANHFLPAEWHSAAVGGFHCRAPKHDIGWLMLIWNVFLGAGDEHTILVNVRLMKFYGGWLTQRPTTYLPSDKNAHSQTYQDKSIIPWFTIPWVPLYKENYFYSPSDGYTES